MMKKLLLLLTITLVLSCEKDDVEANSQDIQSLSSQISQLRGSLDTLVALNQQYQGQIQNVQNQANSSSSSISSIQSDLSSIENSLSNLTSSQSVSQNQISQLTQLIELLIIRVNELEDNILNAQVFIPDDNFESALIQLGYDNVLDNYVLRRNIIDIKNLNVERNSISSLAGIESFSSLEKLIVSYNNLSNINVANNIKLKHLDLYDNNISSIDVSKNSELEILVLNSNPLNSLSVVNNSKLKELYIFGTNVSSLNLLNNNLLTDLDVGSTQISSLNLKNNTSLDRFLGYSSSLGCVELNDQVINQFPMSCQNSDPSTCYSYKNFNFSQNVYFKNNCNLNEYSTNSFLDHSFTTARSIYNFNSSGIIDFASRKWALVVKGGLLPISTEWTEWNKGQYGVNQGVQYLKFRPVSTNFTYDQTVPLITNQPEIEIYYNLETDDLLMVRVNLFNNTSTTINESCTVSKHFVYKRFYPNRLNNVSFTDNCQSSYYENMNSLKAELEAYLISLTYYN